MDTDMDLMEEILARVDWKSGIRPLGNLATEVCFVQKEMPVIKRLDGNVSTSVLVTQSSWTSNLVDTCILSNLNNDTTMHSLSELHLLFHTRQQQPGHRTLHHLHLDSQAYFSVNHILRPTIKFQRALEAALSHLNVDNERAWQELCKVWHDFGYLWPQKIILGHRHHVKHNYQVKTDSERVYQLQVAKDHTTALLEMKLRKSQSKEKTRNSIGSSHGHYLEPIQDTDYWRRITSSWHVIKRDDVRPIYEFLPTPMRDSIHHLIKIFVHRIPINQPFMLKSVSTNGYLSWRLNPKQRQHPLNHDTSLDYPQLVPGNHHSDLQQKASIIFSTLPLDGMKSTHSFCVWQFNDRSRSLDLKSTHYSSTPVSTKYVRCGSQLYLTPCMPPTLHNQDIILTRSNSSSSSIIPDISTSSPVSGMENSNRHRGWDIYVEKASRVRSVEFFDKQHSDHESSQHYWTVETPDLGLDLDDDFSTDGHLNVDIAIGRQKPILNQEIISLRQILYLCSVYSQIPRTSSTLQTKRRSTNSTSQSPPIVIPSPVPPAAAGVMAMFRKISSNDDDDKRAFSHPSTILGNSQHKRNRKSAAAPTHSMDTLASPPPLSHNPPTTNTSESSLPYYNLHTYTVLPPSLVTSSCIATALSPGFSSPHPASSPHQHCFNPVLAKEHSLINGPEESYWIIELLSKGKDKGASNTQPKNNGTCDSGYSTQIQPPQKDPPMSINPKENGINTTLAITSSHRRDAIPTPLRLKLAMSSDTLRDDAKEEMIGGSNGSADHLTLRRVQSFSSVHDLQQQQQYLEMVPRIKVFGGKGHKSGSGVSNSYVETTPKTSGMVTASETATLSPFHQPHVIPDGLLQANATDNIQPYLQLYISKQNTKTWSHVIKHSTLASIKRWLKTA